jgi:glycosyltransferase involved in cell wall biosynthesis
VLIVQPSLRPPGGGQAVAAWMIHALQDEYDIALAMWEAPDFDRVNAAYGTAIRGGIDVHTVRPAVAGAIDRLPFRAALLKWATLIRLARRVSRPTDLLISAENEADFGRPGIQYVHYPRQLRPRPVEDIRWYHRPPGLLDLYYGLCDRLIAFSMAGVQRNLTLANSEWTADRLRVLNPRLAVTVVPPPVAAGFPDVPWDRREDGFVCVGRFAVEKELEKVAAIVDAVRRTAPHVTLHLVGGRDSSRYYRRVRRLAERHRDWIRLHENVPRDELRRLIASQRYGIHGMREEHFGIAPAEMAAGGCIVFVPNGGGQVEIVGDARLTYDTVDDAVAKIAAVLRSPGEQRALRAILADRQERFTAARFCATIQRLTRSGADL